MVGLAIFLQTYWMRQSRLRYFDVGNPGSLCRHHQALTGVVLSSSNAHIDSGLDTVRMYVVHFQTI